MHRNLRPPEPRTPPFYGFNYHAMPSLKSRNLSTVVLQRFCCWYITLRCDLNLWPRNLDLWPLTLNICSVSRVTLQNSVPNLNAIEQSVAELLLFSVWPYDLKHCVTCCARFCDNFHQVWPLTTYPCLNYIFFDADTLYHAVTLTFGQLTLKVCGTSSVTWSKSVRNLSKIEQSRLNYW